MFFIIQSILDTMLRIELFLLAIASARQITVNNRCNQDIWVATLSNSNVPPLGGGLPKISRGGSFAFTIPDNGWNGRMWPKLQCDISGQNCEVGQVIPPCGPHGCQPPSDTKMQFFFPSYNDPHQNVKYDISLVDGYSIPVEVIPSIQQGECTSTRCTLSLDECPTNENTVGDLRVLKNGTTLSCLSPCKKWNYPSPYGLGLSETKEPGLHFCCPYPPVTSEECIKGPVVQSQYVTLARKRCPTAYSFAFDNKGGVNNCPSKTDLVVNFCF